MSRAVQNFAQMKREQASVTSPTLTSPRVLDKHKTVNLGDLRKEFQDAQEKSGQAKNNLVSLNSELAWLTAKQAELERKETEQRFDEGLWGKSKLIYVPDDNGKKVIQGGTLGDLVSFLLDNDDDDFMEGFLYVHTYFVPSTNLFTKLGEMFHQSNQEGSLSKVQLRILQVVRLWISHQWYYFARDTTLEERLQEFIASLMKDVNIKDAVGALKLNKSEELKDLIVKTKLFTGISESFMKYNKERLLILVTNALQRSPIVKSSKKRLRTVQCVVAREASDYLVNNLSISKEDAINLLRDMAEAEYLKHATNDLKSFVDGNHLYQIKMKKTKQEKERDKKMEKEQKERVEPKTFMDISPMEAACQLTLLESNMFRKIAPAEMMHQSWNSKDAKAAPNLAKLIQRFNEVSYWVASEIVTVENLKNRVEVVKRFILVCEYCRQLNNFSTVMAIVVGLNLGSVQRLEKTWLSIPPKYMQTYNALLALTSSSQNYKAYREAISGLNAPLVPYIGVYLRDLTFIEDGNETFLNKTKLVNYEKMRMLAHVFRDLVNFQSQPYPLKDDPVIQKYLMKDRVFYEGDGDLRNHSLLCEPSKRNSIALTDPKALHDSLAATNPTQRASAEKRS